jgi:hypothetical protein
MKKTFFIILLMFLFSSCTSLTAYHYVLKNDYDGKEILAKEIDVQRFTEKIISDSLPFSMQAFNRVAIDYHVKKTPKTTHSFYVLTDTTGQYYSLSFCATSKNPRSTGAWALNTKWDIESYQSFISGDNIWQVEKIATLENINSIATLRNILEKIKSNNTYYFRSKINPNDNHDNCNSALMETLSH